MIYLISNLATNFLWSLVVALGFLLIFVLFKVFGGDKAQANRSPWFPLVYIVPVMIAVFLFFLLKYLNN